MEIIPALIGWPALAAVVIPLLKNRRARGRGGLRGGRRDDGAGPGPAGRLDGRRQTDHRAGARERVHRIHRPGPCWRASSCSWG